MATIAACACVSNAPNTEDQAVADDKLDAAAAPVDPSGDAAARDAALGDAMVVPPPPEDAAIASDAAISDAGPSPDSPAEAALDFLEQLAHPLAPALSQPGHAFLRSSRQPEEQIGMRNLDFSNFLGSGEGVAVLADEAGAGVVTRMWFTVGPPGLASGDNVRLRIWIDGAVLPLTDDPNGVTLTELTSGKLSGLPHPWVLAPGHASGGYVVNVPIHYSNGLRIELVNPQFLGPAVYYQIEGRSLPSPPAHSFSVPPARGHDAALTQALGLWRDHAHPGDLQAAGHPKLDPDQTLSLSATGEGVISELTFAVGRALRELVDVELEIDGDLAVSTSLAWLTGSGTPAGDYVSSLTAASEDTASLYYPIPYRRSVQVRLRHRGSGPRPVSVAMRIDARPLPANTGHFRATCGSSRVEIPMPKLDDWNSPLEFPNVVVVEPLKGPGWYSGQSIYLHSPVAWGWALEPDHEIFVDDDYPILGTGSEDYFGGAFYFMNGPFASLLSGASGWLRDGGEAENLPSDTHVYRHHMVGSIPFERELRFEYESYINGARYDGCLFWYSAP